MVFSWWFWLVLVISNHDFCDCSQFTEDCYYGDNPTLWEILPTDPYPGPWDSDDPELFDPPNPFTDDLVT